LLSIDYILMLEVLEHVQNPEDFVHKALSAANDSIFISFPNTGYIKHRLRLLFGRFPVQWRVHPGEHLRFWTLRDLEWWLGQLKLKDKSTIHSYEGVPILNKIYSGMFSAAFIVEIKK